MKYAVLRLLFAGLCSFMLVFQDCTFVVAAQKTQPQKQKVKEEQLPVKKPAEEALACYKRKDYEGARKIWESLANAGDSDAMNNLGILYDRGYGVSVDVGRALHWFAESAKAGNAKGMSNYGWMLDRGRGIPQNPREAARWYDKSARLGQVEAQYNLGLMYERGRGVAQNFPAAAAWYSRAAKELQTDALLRLGYLYKEGKGVPKDSAKAQLLLYAASMKGSIGAIDMLESMAPEDASSRGIALFGQRMDQTNRATMRNVMQTSRIPAVRVDNSYICDVYDVHKAVPGAGQMTVCYGEQEPKPLGFLKIDYAAASKNVAEQIHDMVCGRFGSPQASESPLSSLWNMGTVLIATQYVPDLQQISLMYMVPRVYYKAKAK